MKIHFENTKSTTNVIYGGKNALYEYLSCISIQYSNFTQASLLFTHVSNTIFSTKKNIICLSYHDVFLHGTYVICWVKVILIVILIYNIII